MREREKERERGGGGIQRHRHAQRDGHTGKQTDRQTDR